MKLDITEEAAIDIEEILNWIDIRQGYEAKNQWFDNFYKYSRELINRPIERHFSLIFLPKYLPGLPPAFSIYQPYGWNYQIIYTMTVDRITIERIREVPQSS